MKGLISSLRQLSVCLVIGLVGTTIQALAAPVARGPLPPRHPEDPTPLPYYDSGQPSVAHDAQSATTPYSWSKIAFQSYQDGNWEIYFRGGDGSAPTRLSYDGASDIHPRLNRGNTQIVFASNRAGDYKLFKMNSNGVGLQQLTSAGGDDVHPVWSPDGVKIAFQSNRDGQAEIYVMNADGSGTARLTTTDAFDGMPTWSPNGAKLAFVSNRTGAYRVWVMNANGTGQVQLSSQPNSFNPAWSPDGSLIAYDADGNADGWQEAWLMNADGGNQHEVYYPNLAQTDAWVNSWSPDGKFVTLTSITFVFSDGQWYWTSAYLDALEVSNGIATRLTTTGTEWNGDWQTTDITSPQSQVLSLPAYGRAANLEVNWPGADAGGSGILNYDLQYRLGDSGAWTDWLSEHPAVGAVFTGSPGAVVHFRSRARDQAYNLEAWPLAANGDATTTLFQSQIFGHVFDIRNQPVVGSNVTVAPTPLLASATNPNGAYTVYTIAPGTHSLTTTKVGYGASWPVVLTAISDTLATHWLPPPNSLVANGNFEAGDLSAWLVSGHLPPSVRSDASHTGTGGALLGSPSPLGAPWLVRDTVWQLSFPSGGLAPNGRLHLAWHEWTDYGRIYYASCSADGNCQPPQHIHNGFAPQLAVGSDGVVHLIWTGGNHLMYSYRSLNGVWSSPENTGEIAYGSGIAITLDSSNRPHVAWYNELTYYAWRDSNGQWSSAEEIGNDPSVPALAIDNTGKVHAAFASVTLSYRVRTPGIGWSVPVTLDTFSLATQPSIAVDSQGGAHVSWRDSSEGGAAHYRYRDPFAVWSDTITLQSGNTYEPRLIMLPDDVLAATWGDNGTPLIAYRRGLSDWSAPHPVYSDAWSGTDSVGLARRPGTDELALVAAGNYFGGATIHANSFVMMPELGGSSRISQVITVTADLHAPTLGVSYLYGSESTGATHGLHAYVDNGTGQTGVMMLAPSSQWQHAWFDLSPWLGQVLTVTLELTDTLDGYYTWARVDEVTVGSWLTPIIETVSPAAVTDLSDLPRTITVTGQNFIAPIQLRIGNLIADDVVWIDPTTFTATLPVLPPGQYDISVVNLGGPESVLSFALKIGRLSYLPAVIR